MLIHLWQTPMTLMRARFADVYVLVAGRDILKLLILLKFK